MEQEDVWDKVAGKWAEFRKVGKPVVLDFLEGKKGRILDLGCGSGRHFVEGRGVEFYGVDFSEEMLRFAAERGIAKELKCASFDRIPYGDNFFDWAVFAAALHCVEDAGKRKDAVYELYRVLRKEGEAVVTVLSKNHKRVKKKGKECYVPWSVGDEKLERYTYVFDKKEIAELFREVGFKVVWVKEDKRNISLVVRK